MVVRERLRGAGSGRLPAVCGREILREAGMGRARPPPAVLAASLTIPAPPLLLLSPLLLMLAPAAPPSTPPVTEVNSC